MQAHSRQRSKKYQYEKLGGVPLRNNKISLKINWINLEITDPIGKIKSSTCSFITALNPSKDNIESLFEYARS